MNKNFEDMQTMNKVNMDATMKSFDAVTKGTQAIATEIADYSRRSLEDGLRAAEKLIGAKSPDKAFEVQSEYAKAAYESYVSEVTKLGELYSDLAKEAFKPYESLAARVPPAK
jgi:phasin family protein